MDFILKTAKRKLPLHENSFVKATAPFLVLFFSCLPYTFFKERWTR